MANKPDIKYLNKDFNTFKSNLIEYAKAYFPTSYNDFSQASPGSMFINMASYVGDVLSFYLDNQIQETYLQYARQKNNLFALAYTLGYTPKVTSAAIVELEVFQVVPSVRTFGLVSPDFNYSLTIAPGMVVTSNVNSSAVFFVPQKVDFRTSSSFDPVTVDVYQTNGSGEPISYLLKKKTNAISGVTKTQSFTFGAAQRFSSITLSDSNIISIVSAVDSSGNEWYEVPYLAQDYVYNPVANLAANYPDLYQDSYQVPYVLEKTKVDRRFTSRFTSNENLVIEFGSGVNTIDDDVILPNPATVGIGLTTGSNTINKAFDPTNFVTTKTYGLAPSNTTITVTYLVGGGAQSNVLANQLTVVSNVNATGINTSQIGTVATNNPMAAEGGGDGDDIEELRRNIANEFSSQMRAVTQQDYLSKALSMPSKYGKISKAYMTKDDITFNNYLANDSSNKDKSLVTMYVLSLNTNGTLAIPTNSLFKNLQTYLSEYRMMTDAINLKSAYIVNIKCNFDITIRPNYIGQDVIARCITALKDYFNISNWEINEPIVLNDIYVLLDKIDGVQTVRDVNITNVNDTLNGYSKYSYDIAGATIQDVIYPSLDPCIFEIKYPDTDIQGRVVS
jgi:phage-related baseplate assembly protein